MADQRTSPAPDKAAPVGTPKPYAPLPPGQEVPSMPALWGHAMKNYGRYQVLFRAPWPLRWGALDESPVPSSDAPRCSLLSGARVAWKALPTSPGGWTVGAD